MTSVEVSSSDVGDVIAIPATTAKRRTGKFDFAPATRASVNTATTHIDAASVTADSTNAVTVSSQVSTRPLDPLIEGTRIPIYRLAALSDGGLSVDEIAEDFPSLTKQHVLEALLYAADYPPDPSINYPRESFKRFLLNTGFSALSLSGTRSGRRKEQNGVHRRRERS